MRVAAVRPEGPEIVSIDVTGRHLEELEAEGGQLFRWRFLHGLSSITAYPFSLSAAPSPGRLRLTVKALGPGSSRLQTMPVRTGSWPKGPTVP